MNTNDDNLLEDSWESRLIDYSMGAMESTDAAEFERQLNECRVHVKLADHYAQVVGWMGAAVTPTEPPVGHKNRLMSRLAATPQETTAPTVAQADDIASEPLQTPRTLTAVPHMAAYGGSTGAESEAAPVMQLDEYRARRAGGNRTLWIAAAAAVLALMVLAGWLSTFLARPYLPPGFTALLVKAQAVPGYENSAAALIWNPNSREAYLYANNLQQLPADQVYEMWLLQANGDPIPAGIFNAGSGGTARHEIQAPAALGRYAGVAVSVEKAPGGPAPGGPVIMVAQYGTPNQ